MADDNIRIIAELRDLISRPALQASAALDHLEDEVQELDRAFRAGEISQRQYVNGMKRAAIQSRVAGAASRKFRREVQSQINVLGNRRGKGLRGALRFVGDETRVLGKNFLRTSRTVATTGVKGILSGASALAKMAGEGVKTGLALFGMLPRVAKLAVGFSILIPIITAVGGAIVAMLGSAAPMAGMLGAIPGLGLAAGAGLGVAAVGVGSLMEGIMMLAKGEATVEEMNEFWAKFTPEAKEFGVAVASIAPGLTRIRDAIQRSMLPSLGTALVDIATRYVPFFEQKLGDIAGAIGRVSTFAAETFTSPAFYHDMTLVWDSTTRLVETLGRAGVRVMSGLRGLMVAAIPLTERVGSAIEGAFTRFDNWANSPVGQNKMKTFFDDAWETSKTFLGGLKDLLIALWNISQIGKDLGDSLGGGMRQALADFRAWTESTAGQERIRQFFIDIKDTLAALGRLGSAVFKELFETGAGKGEQNSAVKMIDGVTAAVPGIFEVIRALIAFAGHIGTAILWVARFFEMLGKVPGVGGILQWVAGILLFVTRGRILGTILGFLGRLLVWVFTGPVAAVLRFLGHIAMVILRSQALWRILGLVGRILLFAFGGWVGVLIAAIAGGLYLLWTRSETFRNVLKTIGGHFREAFGQIYEVLIKPIIDGIKSLVEWIGRIDWPSPPDWMGGGQEDKNSGGKGGSNKPGFIKRFVTTGRLSDGKGWWKEGGPVMPGNYGAVGEAGRELLLTGSGVSMLGASGRENVAFTEPGIVVPNPLTERLLAAVQQPGAPSVERMDAVPSLAGVGARGGSSGEAAPPMPTVSVGPFYGAHPDEVRQAVSQGIRDAQRQSETKHSRRP